MKKTYQPVGEEAVLISSSDSVPNVNTIKTSNTEADLNVCLAADDIIEIFENQGFTTDSPPDIELLRHMIVETIQKRMTENGCWEIGV